MRRNYTVDFLCHFELENYPFDRQSCDVGLVSVDGQVRLVRAGHSPRYNTVGVQSLPVNSYSVSSGNERSIVAFDTSKLIKMYRERILIQGGGAKRVPGRVGPEVQHD